MTHWSDLVKNGDSFEFIPGIEGKVLHTHKSKNNKGKTVSKTTSISVDNLGERFYSRFKLNYDKENSRFVISVISKIPTKTKKLYGSDVDLVFQALQRWEAQNPFGNKNAVKAWIR